MQKKYEYCQKNLNYEPQKKLVRLRQRAHDLYFVAKMSKRAISRRLKVSRNFVLSWTKKKKMDFTLDHRGWTKGKGRKWDKNMLIRIARLHRSLTKREGNFFCGATVIGQAWLQRYKTAPPPLRTIGRMLKQLGL